MNTWFSSDLHLGHQNIIKYCNRPFNSVREMNDAIISNWNEVVSPKDEVYVLGDFAFAKIPSQVEDFANQLNGKIYLIYGNHDRSAVKSASCFVWKKDICKIKIQGQKIVLCHFAMRVWDASHYGSWHLYGHCHGRLPEPDNLLSCDVGVDAWNFYPVSFEQIQEKMDQKKFTPINRRKSH